MLAAQGIVNVARNTECTVTKPCVEARYVDGGKRAERAAAVCDVAPVRAEKMHAERARHAVAAVGGGAAAQADDELPAAAVERGADELAGTVRRRGLRVAQFFFNERQTGRRRHFDDCDLPCDAETRRDGAPKRVRRGHVDVFAAEPGHDGVHCALAAVGNRHDFHFRVRRGLQDAVTDDGPGLIRRKITLKGIHCN